jgi:tetratricopeptide (TPR) repeat protein
MARYDRIAPLNAPAREGAFPGWLVLRDIEGNDRDIEGARRARLRFLALRPVSRLLERGVEGISRESYLAQIEAVREELGYLPARDVERARLARFLHHVEDRDASRVTSATLEMADACAAAGQTHGAEEYAMTAAGLAAAHADERLHGVAHTTLARVYRTRGQLDDAERSANTAIAIAERLSQHTDLVQARAELALVAVARGAREGSVRILHDTLQQMRAAGDAQAAALTEAKLCACGLALGEPSAALEHGWSALRQLDDLRERAILLENVAIAFSRVGLHRASERCYSMVAQRGVDPTLRARARAAQAVESAAGGSAAVFRERRSALINDAAEWSADPRIAAFVHLELGRGCVIASDLDFARDHLRDAISIARRHNLGDILARAEEVLTALEKNSTRDLVAVVGGGPTDSARKIAEQLDALPDLALTST